tara:strand:- start:1397 stop:1768 length:372 start_codon:yes stop_codon:yes gene_type:complete
LLTVNTIFEKLRIEMTDEHHERVYIDHQAATTLSEVMVQTALEADLNVLTTFAAAQLTVLSLSGIVLTMATAPEDFEENKKTLIAMTETVSGSLKILQAKDPMSANAEFEFTAKMLTDKIVIH